MVQYDYQAFNAPSTEKLLTRTAVSSCTGKTNKDDTHLAPVQYELASLAKYANMPRNSRVSPARFMGTFFS